MLLLFMYLCIFTTDQDAYRQLQVDLTTLKHNSCKKKKIKIIKTLKTAVS